MKVWKVEDGATHWVAARHPGEMGDLCAKACGVTRTEWSAQYAPTWKEVPSHELIDVRMEGAQVDPESLDGPLPRNYTTTTKVTATARAWAEACGPGIIASTEV